MKKALLVVFLALILVGNIFAQGEKEESGPITIEFWTHEDASRQALEEQYIKDFEATHPNVKINRSVYASTKIPEIVQTAYAAGEGPDIFNLQISHEYSYIANGLVAPISYDMLEYKNEKAFKDHYMDGILDPVTYKGKVYGMPLEITNWVIYVDKNVFYDAGLNPEKDYPKTWEEMVELAPKLIKREGDVITRRAFDFNYDLPIPQFQPMIEQCGGKFVSKDGKEAIVGKEGWIKFLTFMQQWGPCGKNYGSPTLTIARKYINKDNNDMAMAMAGLYQIPRIKKDNPKYYESDNWCLIPFPRFADAPASAPSASFIAHYYMVNSDCSSAKQKVCWEFINYMLSHPIDYLTDGGTIVQPVKGILDTPEMKALRDSDVVLADLANSDCILYGDYSIEFEALLKNAITQVMIEGVSPEEAYNNLKTNAQEVLDSLK